MFKTPLSLVLITAICASWCWTQPASASVRGEGFLRTKKLKLSDSDSAGTHPLSPESPIAPARAPTTPPTFATLSPSSNSGVLSARSVDLPPTPCKKRPSQPHWRNALDVVSWEEFQSPMALGAGQYANVWKVQENNQNVILKILKDGVGLGPVKAECARQVRAAQAGIAPRILGDVFQIGTEEEYSHAFRMEYIPNSISLRAYLGLIKELAVESKMEKLQKIAAMAFRALDLLPQDLTHNDLAPENILVVGGADPSEGLLPAIERVLLIDFGVVYDEGGHPEYHVAEAHQLSSKDREFIGMILILLEAAQEFNPQQEAVSIAKKGAVRHSNLPTPAFFSKRVVPTLSVVREKVSSSKVFDAGLKQLLEERLDRIGMNQAMTNELNESEEEWE